MPRQGLGNSAIASVANDEQLERFEGTWAAMAITEPGFGSDSAAISTTRGPRRRRVRPQRREDLRHLRRARRQRRRLGDARQVAGPRGDQVVRGREGHARHEGRAARAQARHPRLRHRGDHVHRLPGPDGEPARLARGQRQAGLRRRDGDLRQHPAAGGRDGRRLRPGVARPHPRPAGGGRRRGRLRPAGLPPVRGRGEVPPDRGRLGGRRSCSPCRRPGWPTTASPTRSRPRWPRRRPAGSAPTSRSSCVELCASVGYGETELLEKWARDSKILDIFEGTQQIQQLIVARRLLGLSSAELK